MSVSKLNKGTRDAIERYLPLYLTISWGGVEARAPDGAK